MHYIRLVVLGDSQVGKTSLIKQLVGQEFKFEPELREANKCEKSRRQLDADWHMSLEKHENALEQSIKTKRLATLLASQLELQQLLLQQQRGGNPSGREQQREARQASKRLRSIEPEGSGSSGLRDNARPTQANSRLTKNEVTGLPLLNNNTNSNKQPEQQLYKPTILISTINSSEKLDQSAEVPVVLPAPLKSEAPFTSFDPSLRSKKEHQQQTSFAHSATRANQMNESIIEESCDSLNYSRCEEQPILTVTSTSANELTTNRREDAFPAGEQEIDRGGENNANEDSSFLNQNHQVIQHHTLAQKHKSLETGRLGGQQAARQQHRHSYCAPGEQGNARNESASSGSPSKSGGQLSAKQSSELSTQAKIINILFTRNEQKVEQGVGGDDRANQQQKSGKQMLMPSLLRQYQRRLSNFHHVNQSSNVSCKSDQDSNRKSLNEEPKDATNFDGDNKRIMSGSRAAASLATAAASAAQALVSQQARMVALARQRARCDPVATAGEREEIHHLSKSQSGLSLLVGSQVNLYALTEEYESKLNDQYQRQLLMDNNERMRSGIGNKHRIQHFCVNFMNNMHLYEINIVDMPPIEPVSFPTSSLLEWSLFKGQSHLLTADAYLLVFDLTRPSTIQYIKSLRDKIFESREMSNIPAYVIANKADLCPTLQLSLQTRRMRSVAARRHQASINNSKGQSTFNTASASATGVGATATSAAKATSPRSPATHSHPSSINRFSSSWSRLRRDTRPTIDLGVQYTRAVPTKAAHQLISAYKEHRTRLGSSGPMVSLRRWAKLRRAIVRTNDPASVCNSAQWLQFERTRAQCKLAFGAPGQDSSSHQLVSSMGKALVRFRSRVNDRFRHFVRTKSDSRHRCKMRVDTGLGKQGIETQFGQRRTCSCNKRCRRKRRKRCSDRSDMATVKSSKEERTPARRLEAISRWFSQSSKFEAQRQRQRHRQHPQQSSQRDKTRVSFTSYGGVQTSPSDGERFAQSSNSNFMGGLRLFSVSSQRRLKTKRKRRDQSDSSGSKSGSLRSRSGSKRKQMADSGLRQYSKLLTTAAKQSSQTENELTTLAQQGSSNLESSSTGLAVGAVSNTTSTLAAPTGQLIREPVKSSCRIEPVCGYLGTTSSRQSFYDLFNKLLQTSSTTVAKTQLTLKSIQGDESEKPEEGGDSEVISREINRAVIGAPPVALLQVNPNEEHKEEKRRKSSSTGAALWQTLSSLALNRGSRSSVFGNSDQTKRQTDNLGQSSALTQTAKAELEQQQSRRNTQTVLAEGVHLGTDQYLSVDMLRKLSLISSSSQVSGSGSTVLDGTVQEIGEADGKTGAELRPDRPNSAPTSTVNSKNKLPSALVDSNSIDQAGKLRPSTAEPDAKRSTRAQRIWYRGVMKKILFQSNNKRSLKSIVTAVRLQKHINEMYEAEQKEDRRSSLDKSPCSISSSPVKNHPSEGSIAANTNTGTRTENETGTMQSTKDKYDRLIHGERSKETLALQTAPSIRIITSGSSLSLMSGENGEKYTSGEGEERMDAIRSEMILDKVEHDRSGSPNGDNSTRNSPQTEPVLKDQRGLSEEETCDVVGGELTDQGATDGISAGSVADSLSSLSESVSLSVEMIGQARGRSSNAEPRTRRTQSASAGQAMSASTHLDSITETLGANQAQSAETLNGPGRNLSELQQPGEEDVSGVRKLSADDCLILNRQRRKSRAMAEDADNEENWLFVGEAHHKYSASAEPTVPNSRAGSTLFDNYRDGGHINQREGVRSSLEMAVGLLVPRTKGARSASITLGVNESQHKSLSQLGSTILGAMNVQRTWRDWRHFLAKKKSVGADFLGDFNSTKPTQAVKPKNEGSALVFLETHKAFARLSLDQQREAATNFDQLMRFNQLTLSAANLVMMSTGQDTREIAKPSTSHLKHQQQQQQQAGSAGSGLVRDNSILVAARKQVEGREIKGNSSVKESMIRRVSGNRQPQALMTRLQSGGNLLLGRSNTKRELKTSDAVLNSSSLAELGRAQNIALGTEKIVGVVKVGDERFLEPANSLVCLTASEPPISDVLEAVGLDAKQVGETVIGPAVLNAKSDIAGSGLEAAGKGKGGPSLEDSNMSARIASAAASALERQKRRGEELSLILEPRYDKKQAGAQYPLFVNNDLNPILKDLAQLVRKHWKCNYIECSAASNWNIKPIISELTRALECNQTESRTRLDRARLGRHQHQRQHQYQYRHEQWQWAECANEQNALTSDEESCDELCHKHGDQDKQECLNGKEDYDYDCDCDYEYEEDEEDEEGEGGGDEDGVEFEEDGDSAGSGKCSHCRGTSNSWLRSGRLKRRSRRLVKNRQNNHPKQQHQQHTLESTNKFRLPTNKRRPLDRTRLMTRIFDPISPKRMQSRSRLNEVKLSSVCPGKTLLEEEKRSLARADKLRLLAKTNRGGSRDVKRGSEQKEPVSGNFELLSERPTLVHLERSFERGKEKFTATKGECEGSKAQSEPQNGTNCFIM